MAEAGGEARLPDSVTVSDFRTWAAAIAADDEEKRRLSFKAVCTVSKVADILDDKSVCQWVHLAADTVLKLLQALPEASSTDCQDHKTRDDTGNLQIADCLSGLSELPYHTQCQVFKAVLGATYACEPAQGPDLAYLHSLLDFLPQSFHTAVLAAASAPDRILKINLQDLSNNSLFNATLSAPTSPPLFNSLEVETLYGPSGCERKAATRVVEILKQHTGMYSLRLFIRSIDSRPFEVIVPAMDNLTCLRSLCLGASKNRNDLKMFSRCPILYDALPMVQHALSGMPHLESLCIAIRRLPGDERHYKLLKAGRAQDPVPCQPSLSSILSATTNLTSLLLHIDGVWDRALTPESSALACPRLSHLQIETDCTLATSLLDRLIAPLTTLVLEDAHDGQRDEAGVEDLAGTLSSFSRLQHLRVCEDSSCDTWPSRCLSKMLSSSATPPSALHQLQALTWHVDVSRLQRTAGRLGAAFPAMRYLSLSVRNSPRAARTVWADIAVQLSQLQLHGLAISLFCSRDGAMGLQMSQLRPLTSLSGVSLCGPGALQSVADVAALMALTQLQRLHLNDLWLPADCHAALVPGLQTLSSLTSLVLGGSDAATEHLLLPVAIGAVSQMHMAWPALRRLGMQIDSSWTAAQAHALVAAACSLPSLQQLVLVMGECSMDGERNGKAELAWSLKRTAAASQRRIDLLFKESFGRWAEL